MLLWYLSISRMVPLCSGYRYSTTLFNKVWTQILHRYENLWQFSQMKVRFKCLSFVCHVAKTICHQWTHLRVFLKDFWGILKLLLRKLILSKIRFLNGKINFKVMKVILCASLTFKTVGFIFCSCNSFKLLRMLFTYALWNSCPKYFEKVSKKDLLPSSFLL